MKWQLAKDEELDEDQYELGEFEARETRGSETGVQRGARLRVGQKAEAERCTS